MRYTDTHKTLISFVFPSLNIYDYFLNAMCCAIIHSSGEYCACEDLLRTCKVSLILVILMKPSLCLIHSWVLDENADLTRQNLNSNI